MEVVIPLTYGYALLTRVLTLKMNYILKIGITCNFMCNFIGFGALSGKFAASASAGFMKNLRKDMFL